MSTINSNQWKSLFEKFKQIPAIEDERSHVNEKADQTLWFGLSLNQIQHSQKNVRIEVYRSRILKNGLSGELVPESIDSIHENRFQRFDLTFKDIIELIKKIRVNHYSYYNNNLNYFEVKRNNLGLILPELAKSKRLFELDRTEKKHVDKTKRNEKQRFHNNMRAKYLAPKTSELYYFDNFGSFQFKFILNTEKQNRKRILKFEGHLEREGQILSKKDSTILNDLGLILNKNVFYFLRNPEILNFTNFFDKNLELIVNWNQKNQLLESVYSLPPSIPVDISPELQWDRKQLSPIPRLIISDEIDSNGFLLKAELFFRYESNIVRLEDSRTFWPTPSSKKLLMRNFDEEKKLFKKLSPYYINQDQESLFYLMKKNPSDDNIQIKIDQLEVILKELDNEGWEIFTDKGNQVRTNANFSAIMSTEIDWFELKGNINFDDVDVPIPDVLKQIKNDSNFIKLKGGKKGFLPQTWINQLLFLKGLSNPKSGNKKQQNSLLFSKSHILGIDQCIHNIDQTQNKKKQIIVDAKFKKIKKELSSLKGLKPLGPLKSFNGELRDYQKEGLGWLNFLYKYNFGGCLADDMGLGKTVQILAFLQKINPERIKQGKPNLVIVPKSLVENWISESQKFTPNLNLLNYTGNKRQVILNEKKFADIDIIISTYSTVRNDINILRKKSFHLIALDESQAIKNENSQISKAIKTLQAERRLSISGTPIENHLGELFSLFEFLDPQMFQKGTGKSFSSAKQNNHPNTGQQEQILALSKSLRPFFLRRTKEEVLKDLPKKSEQIIFCEMNAQHKNIYNQLKRYYQSNLLKKVKKDGINKSKIHIFEALMRLRQAACHPGLLDRKSSTKKKLYAKADILMENVESLKNRGHKILVFSQFTQYLDIIKSFMKSNKTNFLFMDGKVNNRKKLVQQFQEDKSIDVFLLSLKVGGVGLNLTAADYAFIMDPWWNPAAENQAIDRMHRIGQKKKVFAYKLITKNTVEERVLELQSQKEDLINSIISPSGGFLKKISFDDLKFIFD